MVEVETHAGIEVGDEARGADAIVIGEGTITDEVALTELSCPW